MKTALYALICIATIAIISCGGSSTSQRSTNIATENPDEPYYPPIEPDPVETGDEGTTGNPIILIYYSGTDVKFYDGENITIWKSGAAIKCSGDGRAIVYDNKLITFDEYGNYTARKYTSIIGDTALYDGAYNVYQTSNEKIGMSDYTRVYINGIEQGDFMTRKYKVDHVAMYENEYFIGNGEWHSANGSTENVHYANDDFLISDFSATSRTAKINGVPVSWSANFFNQATRDWQESGGKWYSWNGYIFDGVSLDETTSINVGWRKSPYNYQMTFGESPYIVAVGTRVEYGETVLYWLECDSGWMFRQIPSLNKIEQVTRLYIGNGTRASGAGAGKALNPVMTGEYIFFTAPDGYMYQYNFTAGTTKYIDVAGGWRM